jgi:putative PIN family toxin of toxin-antitoxin system
MTLAADASARTAKRVVLDTSVIVAGFRSKTGASIRLIEAALDGYLIPIATPALFFEYEEVLKRPKHLAASEMTIEVVDRALDSLAVIVDAAYVPTWSPQLPDPKDECVLAAAVFGKADALITHNVRHFLEAATRLNVRLVRPADFLGEVFR